MGVPDSQVDGNPRLSPEQKAQLENDRKTMSMYEKSSMSSLMSSSATAATGVLKSDEQKKDGGKLPLHLCPPEAFTAMAAVLDFGAKKYRPRGWEAGMDWSRLYGAAMRHLLSWFGGQDLDPETGFNHLWHALCCVSFLVAYEQRHTGTDDRPVTK